MVRKVRVSAALLVFLGSGLALIPGSARGRTPRGVGTAQISVAPRFGGPRTAFAIRFTAPRSTGRHGGVERRYLVSVSGPAGEQGCLDGADRALPFSRLHARVKVVLDPGHLGGPWCKGRFHGRLEEIQEAVCPHGRACPQYVILLGTVGRFSFDVGRRPRRDTTPPTFAGLKAANACTPGAQRPGETTPFTLTWDPATDAATPSAKIVYDVYESGTQGGESFSHPSWTTRPGVTSFQTPGLPSHGTFYFVVRARDQAGNEDRNRVERLGIDPCL